MALRVLAKLRVNLFEDLNGTVDGLQLRASLPPIINFDQQRP